MYCTNCGQSLGEESRFCSQCGKPAAAEAPPAVPGMRLMRIREGKKIAGVCAGFARYLGVDVMLVRIVWLVTALTAGVGFIAYAIAWIAMPMSDASVPLQPNGDRYAVPQG
jgi:phage shock protein C